MQNVHLSTTVIQKMESNLTHTNTCVELDICVVGMLRVLTRIYMYSILNSMSVYSTPDLCICIYLSQKYMYGKFLDL